MQYLTEKKAPAAIGQLEENGCCHFSQKKGACGNRPVGGKWFQPKKYPILSYFTRPDPILPHFFAKKSSKNHLK